MTRVFVYMNKHATKANHGVPVYSVKAMEGPNKGRVIMRSPHVLLGDVQPKVSQAGRLRVIREGRKNVHAGLVGTLIHTEHQPFHGEKITYNPHKYEGFVFSEFDTVYYKGSEFAYLTDSGVEIVEPKRWGWCPDE